MLLEIFRNCHQYKNTNIGNSVLIVLLEMNNVNELMQTWNIVLIYPLTVILHSLTFYKEEMANILE